MASPSCGSHAVFVAIVSLFCLLGSFQVSTAASTSTLICNWRDVAVQLNNTDRIQHMVVFPCNITTEFQITMVGEDATPGLNWTISAWQVIGRLSESLWSTSVFSETGNWTFTSPLLYFGVNQTQIVIELGKGPGEGSENNYSRVSLQIFSVQSKTSSVGKKVGIAVGVTLITLLLIGGVFLFVRQKRRRGYEQVDLP